jgi:Holliday junction resolvase RusA-like endonuclease
MSYRFEIPGKPVPQERRIHIRGQWAFDPPKSRTAKRIVKQYAMAARPKLCNGFYHPSDYSFCIEMFFYGPHWGSDLDNLVKLVMDGMKGVFWKDDHQVVEMFAKKIRVPKGSEKTVVGVTELKPEAIEEIPREGV